MSLEETIKVYFKSLYKNNRMCVSLLCFSLTVPYDFGNRWTDLALPNSEVSGKAYNKFGGRSILLSLHFREIGEINLSYFDLSIDPLYNYGVCFQFLTCCSVF